MFLGYNTNGLAHHSFGQAVGLLAELGYQGVAITIDHHVLNPFALDLEQQLSATARLLERYGMRSVVETGARYLLDARRKHEPTLVSPQAADRGRRIDFLKHAIDVAQALQSDCVSLWSGVVHDAAEPDEVWPRLTESLRSVLDYAAQRQVTIGFEPEPGMFIDTMPAYDELCRRLNHPPLKLTLDIGHLHCQGETPLADYIRQYGPQLVNVHIEDMRAGVHEHLMLGEGEIDFPAAIDALIQCGYRGGTYVELSRHSHEGPVAARRAIEFLKPLVGGRSL